MIKRYLSLKKKRTTKKRLIYEGATRFDWPLLMATILLALFGLSMVYEASAVSAFRQFADRFHFVRDQALWLFFGFIGMMFMSFFPHQKLYSLSLPILLLTLISLLAVFVPGIGIQALGARRWLNLGLFTLQPAELAKLAMVIYLSAWFSRPERGRLPSFMLLMVIMIGLIILQPDLGTAVIILLVALILYFVSGSALIHSILLLPLVLLTVIALSVISPYRFRRLVTFLDPTIDPLGASYHIRQILISLGSGGLLGVGLGKSLQKYEYLPEATTDSIFAIIAEELGFIGALFFISVFIFFLIRGFRISSRCDNNFGRLLALGISSMIAVQAAINLSSMVILLPLTGVPLPFVSYGGSSLIVSMTAVGILLNISKK